MIRKTISRPDEEISSNALAGSNDTHDQAASIEVIRDLLFGNQQKSNDARITALSCELDRLEGLVLEKCEKAESDLRALETRLFNARQKELSDLSEAIVEIGHSIKRLSVTE